MDTNNQMTRSSTNKNISFEDGVKIAHQSSNKWKDCQEDFIETTLNNRCALETISKQNSSNNNLSLGLRIMIYTACYNVIDGVTITIRKLESAIIESGGHVCVVTTRSGNPKHTNLVPEHIRRRVIFVDDAVQLPFTEDGKDSDQVYYLGKSLSRKVLSEINDFEPNLIHLTVPDCVGLQVIGYARENDVPLMGTYHSNIIDYMDHYGVGFIKPILSAYFRHNYTFLQHLYVPTPYIKQYLTVSPIYNLHRCTDLRVWGRGIDLNTYNPYHRSIEFRESLSIKSSDVVVLFVGRLVYEKRPDIFANVIRRLHAKNAPFKALVVGAGQYEGEIKKLPNTICTGWCSNMEELAKAYASSDIFLFPSALETFGNVTLEAAASGLPIVAEKGCSGHLIDNGKSGFACQAADEDAFFEATYRLVIDSELRREFSIASRNVSMKYDKSVLMTQMINNYHFSINEFHTKYQSSHSNRDKAWKQIHKNSFAMGRVAYPLSLRFASAFVLGFIHYVSALVSLFHKIDDRACKPLTSILNFAKRRFSLRFNQICVIIGYLNALKEEISLVSDLESIIEEPSEEDIKRSVSAAPAADTSYLNSFVEIVMYFVLFFVRLQAQLQILLSPYFSQSSTSRKRNKEGKFQR